MKKRKNIWAESWEYLKESRNYIYFTIILFLLGAIVGFAFPGLFGQYFDEVIKDLLTKTSEMNALQLVIFIFQNNLISAFSGLILGVFVGIFPVVNIIVNGTLLGYVMSSAVAVEGFVTIWRLVPHGIFELPAIFISIGLGIKLGTFWFVKKDKSEEFRKRFWMSLKTFVSVVLPLLVIAAIIEGVLIALSG